MKKIVFFSMIFFSMLTTSAWGQGVLHFAYIRQDNSVDAGKLVEAVKAYVNEHRGENYVIYYSDVQPVFMDQSDYNESELSGIITSHNSTISMMAIREINKVSEVLERYRYSKIEFEFLVGPQFFENGYHNTFIARFLQANRLNDIAKASLYYRSCGAPFGSVNMDFLDRYSISIEPIIR